MALDPSFTGSVINALPLDRMIAGPLMAMLKAQVQASAEYANFLTTVCIKEGKALNIGFEYDETVVDTEGNYEGTLKKTLRIPLLAAIAHPNICVETGTVDFELEVSQAEETKSSQDYQADLSASAGWGPFKVKIHGKVAAHKEQTRTSDTRAKYSIHTEISRQGPPEALMRVIDFVTDAATKPSVINLDGQTLDPGKLPEDTAAKPPGQDGGGNG